MLLHNTSSAPAPLLRASDSKTRLLSVQSGPPLPTRFIPSVVSKYAVHDRACEHSTRKAT
eukprot:1292316-Prymnesium_polylepis.2